MYDTVHYGNICSGQNTQKHNSPTFLPHGEKCNFTLEMSLVFISDILCKCICTVYNEIYLTVCQNWLCRGDIRNTSLISFVNPCLRVGSHSIDRSGLLGLCCHRWHTERRETYTARSQNKSHSIPEWRQPLWIISVIHIYSITPQFKLQ